MDKIAELVKAGRIREISAMRDETDLNGLKLAIDLKRGQDPEKVMQKLFRTTPLEDSFACNWKNNPTLLYQHPDAALTLHSIKILSQGLLS